MIICIEGPTAAGKSAIALQLAEHLQTAIISADSRQIYRHMDIGTAKPDADELARVPHHLIDIIDPDGTYNAGNFVKDAEELIASLQRQNLIPIVCGGTGLYIRSLLQGLFEHPPLDPRLRDGLKQELQDKGLDHLYQKLLSCDPDFARRISSNDRQRILRGLEIYLGTGKSISEHWQEQQKNPRHNAFRILVNPEREELYARINKRVQGMMEQGLLSEIENLLSLGYRWQDPGLKTMGYKEFMPYFNEDEAPHKCAALVAQHHRNYAKRQLTWYRRCKIDLTLSPKSFSLSDVLRDITSRF